MPASITRSPYLWLRRTALMFEYARPVYERRMVRHWWQRGRPVPPPHDVKMQAILYLADRIDASALVETGTYRGDTVRALRNRFSKLVSIELVPELARQVQREFSNDPSVSILVGDSGDMLRELLLELKDPALFWLDAHYSGGPTLGDGNVPIYAEIDSINELANARHALLIDDMHEFTGENGYPTQAALIRKCVDDGYEVAVFNNMLHAVSRAAASQMAG